MQIGTHLFVASRPSNAKVKALNSPIERPANVNSQICCQLREQLDFGSDDNGPDQRKTFGEVTSASEKQYLNLATHTESDSCPSNG